MRALLAGSEIRESHRIGDTRVQDPYCIRCQPQVTGAAIDLGAITAGVRDLDLDAEQPSLLWLLLSIQLMSRS